MKKKLLRMAYVPIAIISALIIFPFIPIWAFVTYGCAYTDKLRQMWWVDNPNDKSDIV